MFSFTVFGADDVLTVPGAISMSHDVGSGHNGSSQVCSICPHIYQVIISPQRSPILVFVLLLKAEIPLGHISF